MFFRVFRFFRRHIFWRNCSSHKIRLWKKTTHINRNHVNISNYQPSFSTMANGAEFKGVTFLSGDFVSLFSLFFDNLSTLLGFSGAILAVSSTSTVLSTIVYERIIPAAGIMLFLGNCFYTWQAIRMKNKWGKEYTAQVRTSTSQLASQLKIRP